MSEAKVTELGCPGHLIVAKHCNFRRHTQIGDRYRVSTVGNYYPPGKNEREPIGAGKGTFFETMVFHTTPEADEGSEGCGCHEVMDWCEIEGTRYITAGDAQAGHEEMVEKYIRLVEAT